MVSVMVSPDIVSHFVFLDVLFHCPLTPFPADSPRLFSHYMYSTTLPFLTPFRGSSPMSTFSQLVDLHTHTHEYTPHAFCIEVLILEKIWCCYFWVWLISLTWWFPVASILCKWPNFSLRLHKTPFITYTIINTFFLHLEWIVYVNTVLLFMHNFLLDFKSVRY